jgi:hypothetical protein
MKCIDYKTTGLKVPHPKRLEAFSQIFLTFKLKCNTMAVVQINCVTGMFLQDFEVRNDYCLKGWIQMISLSGWTYRRAQLSDIFMIYLK